MPTGDEAAQYRRLDHLVHSHGVDVVDCPGCAGDGCADCFELGFGFTGAPGYLEPCGPDCPLNEARPQ